MGSLKLTSSCVIRVGNLSSPIGNRHLTITYGPALSYMIGCMNEPSRGIVLVIDRAFRPSK